MTLHPHDPTKGHQKAILTIAGLVVIAMLAFFFTDGKWLYSSVLSMRWGISRQTTNSCNDSDWGKNYEVKWTITTVIDGFTRVEQDSCNSDGTLRERFCGNPGEAAGLLRSENYVTCPNGCNNGVCATQNNGYGYGYGRGGQGTGYGYGYGYKKMDPKTNKPYLYLVNVFKKYSKEVYDAAIGKFGFQMVKSYNKKEFTPTSSR